MKKIKPGCFDCANAVCDECDPDQDARGELWVLLQLRVALGDPTGGLEAASGRVDLLIGLDNGRLFPVEHGRVQDAMLQNDIY